MFARALTAVIVVCCLTLGMMPTGVGDARIGEVSRTDDASRSGTFAQSDVPADDVSLHAEVAPNGTARWTATFRVTFDDGDSKRAFENVSADIEQSPGEWRTRFGDRMRATAATAENATDREMTVRNVTVETRTQSGLGATDYGIVRYTFVWDGFAAQDGDRLVVGDAVAGLYLDANTSLAISWPEGYEPSDVAPSPPDTENEQKVVWEGERDFGPDEPRVTLATAGALGGLPLTATSVLAVAVLAAGALAAGFAWRTGTFGRGKTPDVGATGPDRAETDSESAAGTTGQAAAGPGASDAAAATGDVESDPPEELLSNEERVLRALRTNDGRMKQQALVEELGWTEAKTSQVVSGMRDEGTIEGFRLGRENVLSLPEDDGGEQ